MQTCTVQIRPTTKDNSYVRYGVKYTDVVNGYEFNENNSWRLLTDLSNYVEQRNYTGNIKIVSTGMPAALRAKTYSSAAWDGDKTQISNFLRSTLWSL